MKIYDNLFLMIFQMKIIKNHIWRTDRVLKNFFFQYDLQKTTDFNYARLKMRLFRVSTRKNHRSKNPRGLALKIKAQRLFPSDKFMGVF